MNEQDIIKQAEDIVSDAYNNDLLGQAEDIANNVYREEGDRLKDEYEETIAEVNRALFKLNELNQRMDSIGISREDIIASYPAGREYIESLNKWARIITDFHYTAMPKFELKPEPELMLEPELPTEPLPQTEDMSISISSIASMPTGEAAKSLSMEQLEELKKKGTTNSEQENTDTNTNTL